MMASSGLFFLALASTLSAAPAKRARPLRIGARAPDFDLPGVDGKRHGLKDFARAKILAVIFTCNHCPTAQAYEARIKKLVEDYRDKGVAVVAISPNDPRALRLDELGYTDLSDSFEEMKIRARSRRFTFPYLYDGDTQEVARAYGPRATPHVFIFDANRRLRYAGRIDDAEDERRVTRRDARDAIDALLAGRPVPVERTRTFGCSVKWAEKRAAVARAMEKLAAEPVTVKPIDVKGVKALRENRTEKLRLINLWATWCGACVTEFPELVETSRMYRHRGLEFVTISVDLPDRSGEVLPFLKRQQASNPNYIYASSDRDALAEALGSSWSGALPLTILVRPGGEIAYRHEGGIDPLEVRRAIVGVLGRRYRR